MNGLSIELIAQLLASLGEPVVRRMLTIPGVVCSKQALKNHDQPEEMLSKRDAWVDATIAFAKEFANLDND